MVPSMLWSPLPLTGVCPNAWPLAPYLSLKSKKKMGKEGKEQDEEGISSIGNIKNEKKEEKNNKEMRGLEHSAENGKEERR